VVIRDEARRFEEILRKIEAVVREKGRMELEEMDLTPPQVEVLSRLYFHGSTTQTSLAQELYLAKSTISGILDRLEKRNMVRRTRKDEDRRTAVVKLTPKGELIIQRILEKRAAYLHELLDPLPTDELRKFMSILEEIVKKVPDAPQHI